MDVGTGRISPMELLTTEEKKSGKFMELTAVQEKELRPLEPSKRVSHLRNMLCECGSGMKFKKCCLSKVEAFQAAAR